MLTESRSLAWHSISPSWEEWAPWAIRGQSAFTKRTGARSVITIVSFGFAWFMVLSRGFQCLNYPPGKAVRPYPIVGIRAAQKG